MARKNLLAIAVINRLTTAPVGSAAAWGELLEGEPLKEVRAIFERAIIQDRSLSRAVARDIVLLFESLGGLTLLYTAALDAVGLNDCVLGKNASSSTSRVATDSFAVAKTIQARSKNQEALPQDVAVYVALYEDKSSTGYDRAVNIAAWAGTVTARLFTSGRLPGDEIAVFAPHASFVAHMDTAGWYPNPINAGDTSMGDAQFERWWDGDDWTDRIRIRNGRRWNEQQQSLFTAPSN